MKIKNLSKAAKYYEQIQKLDNEIIEIDKIAMLVANGNSKSNFSLLVEDLIVTQDESNKVKFDEDGSIISDGASAIKILLESHCMHLGGGWNRGDIVNGSQKNQTTLKNELSETATLQILGILIAEKKSQISVLLNKLNQLGIVS